MSNSRYISRGVDSSVSTEIQMLIWNLIDQMDVSPSYIQWFHLSISGSTQKIMHYQEQPSYENVQFFNLSNPMATEICVIRTGSQTIMKLGEEYQEGL